MLISYAQNLEDVMLYRALKHVQNGFYIDVGANDPIVDSVTLAFYELGWHGINIEPLEHHHRDLQSQRPRDINLQVAAGPRKDTLNIWECDVRGWATADPAVIERHRLDGHQGQFVEIPMIPLTMICETHVHGEIHFLKIDVEGFEKSVLDGFDLNRFKPWIVVVEATMPNSTEENHLEWEPILLQSHYRMAYADGLNRFYVSPDHLELMQPLKYPPNVLDMFGTAKEVSFNARIAESETRLSDQTKKINEYSSVIEFQAVDVEHTKSQLAAANLQLNQLGVSINEARLKAELATENSAFALVKLKMQQELIDELRLRAALLSDHLSAAREEETLATEREVKATGQLNALNNVVCETNNALQIANHAFNETNAQLIRANEKINAIYASNSWRLTGPIRRVVRLAKSERPSVSASSAINQSDLGLQLKVSEIPAAAKLDISGLLSEIRSELGTATQASNSTAVSTAAQAHNSHINRLRSIWFRFPPSLRNRIRRLPFFFRVYRWIAFKQ